MLIRSSIKILSDSDIRELIYTMTAEPAKDKTDIEFVKELAEELSIRIKANNERSITH